MTETGDESRKDVGKAPFWLVPWEALWALAELYGKGMEKYGPNQWRDHPMNYSRNYSAMQRHAWKWWGGEEYDPVDGQHHLIAVAWNAFALYTHQIVLKLRQQDDRPFSGPVPQSVRKETHIPAAVPERIIVGKSRSEVTLDLPQVPRIPSAIEDRGLTEYHRGLLAREAAREIEKRRDLLPESAR